MRAERPLIAAVVFLATGLSLIIGYCNGTTSFNGGYPLAASALHLDITTTSRTGSRRRRESSNRCWAAPPARQCHVRRR